MLGKLVDMTEVANQKVKKTTARVKDRVGEALDHTEDAAKRRAAAAQIAVIRTLKKAGKALGRAVRRVRKPKAKTKPSARGRTGNANTTARKGVR